MREGVPIKKRCQNRIDVHSEKRSQCLNMCVGSLFLLPAKR